jgi:hypothetical protein
MFIKKRRTAFSFRCACFKCRIAFHDARVKEPERACPECGTPMVNVGVNFRAPKRQNIRKWKALEKMVLEHGMIFNCKDGHGFIPRSARELDQTVRNQLSDDRYFNDPKHPRRSYRARPLVVQFYTAKYPGTARY